MNIIILVGIVSLILGMAISAQVTYSLTKMVVRDYRWLSYQFEDVLIQIKEGIPTQKIQIRHLNTIVTMLRKYEKRTK